MPGPDLILTLSDFTLIISTAEEVDVREKEMKRKRIERTFGILSLYMENL
jgi:hypothetical protein